MNSTQFSFPSTKIPSSGTTLTPPVEMTGGLQLGEWLSIGGYFLAVLLALISWKCLKRVFCGKKKAGDTCQEFPNRVDSPSVSLVVSGSGHTINNMFCGQTHDPNPGTEGESQSQNSRTVSTQTPRLETIV